MKVSDGKVRPIQRLMPKLIISTMAMARNLKATSIGIRHAKQASSAIVSLLMAIASRHKMKHFLFQTLHSTSRLN